MKHKGSYLTMKDYYGMPSKSKGGGKDTGKDRAETGGCVSVKSKVKGKGPNTKGY